MGKSLHRANNTVYRAEYDLEQAQKNRRRKKDKSGRDWMNNWQQKIRTEAENRFATI